MNQGKYIFAQLTDFLPRRVFDRIVKSHEGNKYVRSFTCWNQMLCMVFGQLTSRDSMRDLMHTQEAFFITKAKNNMRFNRMYSNPVDKEHGVRYDQIGKLETYYPKKEYPDKLRRIKHYDKDTERELIFLTKKTSLTAIEVALLYKKHDIRNNLTSRFGFLTRII